MTTPAGTGIRRYVALGDSYSSGEGAPDPSSAFVWDGRGTDVSDVNMCHRSASAYGPRVASSLGLAGRTQFRFVACSGAVSNYLTQRNKDNTLEPPQFNAFFEPTASTDLVTISIGGNDMGFATIAQFCLLVTNCSTDADFAPGIEDMIRRSEPIWKSIYKQIQTRVSPKTRVMVLTYPQIFGTGSGCSGTAFAALSVDERRWMRYLWSTLNLRIRSAARQTGIEVVDVESAFTGQLICDTIPYANGLHAEAGTSPLKNSMFSFHPNRFGHGRLASAVGDVIKAGAPQLVTAPAMLSAAPDPPPDDPARTLSTGSIQFLSGSSDLVLTDPNRRLTLRLTGFAPGAEVTVSAAVLPGDAAAPEPGPTILGRAVADGTGTVEMAVDAPTGAGPTMFVARGINPVGGMNLLTSSLWLPTLDGTPGGRAPLPNAGGSMPAAAIPVAAAPRFAG